MRRAITTAAFLFALTFKFTALGQEPRAVSSIDPGIQGTQLIAWSVMQTPEPVGTLPSAHPQSLTGAIIREPNRYVLHMQDNRDYELDDQGKAREFAGCQVRIVGKLDESSPKIYVESIGLLS